MQTDSPVGSVQNRLAVYQDELLLQTAVELHPGLTLVLLTLNRTNAKVLVENKEPALAPR